MTHDLTEFLEIPGIIIDVRTPAEFQQGRIPASINLPLFSNDERALVGKIYKKEGRDAAVDKGFRIVGPRMADLAQQVKSIARGQKAKVLCWRGGMRSSAVAWILNMSSVSSFTLNGGYKNFRRWSLKTLETLNLAHFKVLGGLTGAGKTELLKQLKEQGEQVIDLEQLANHRGSSFGGLGKTEQPSNEQFENLIAWCVKDLDLNKTIWVEDESALIGKCKIPNTMFFKMKHSPLYIIDKKKEDRIEHLCNEYAHFPIEELSDCTIKIKKRLGGSLTKEIIELLQTNQIALAFEKILIYYDKTYAEAILKRNNVYRVNCEEICGNEIVKVLTT